MQFGGDRPFHDRITAKFYLVLFDIDLSLIMANIDINNDHIMVNNDIMFIQKSIWIVCVE